MFKKNCANDLDSVEGRRFDNPCAHPVNKPEHFAIIVVGALVYAVGFQGFWCGSPRLIQGSNKAVFFNDLLSHIRIHRDILLGISGF